MSVSVTGKLIYKLENEVKTHVLEFSRDDSEELKSDSEKLKWMVNAMEKFQKEEGKFLTETMNKEKAEKAKKQQHQPPRKKQKFGGSSKRSKRQHGSPNKKNSPHKKKKHSPQSSKTHKNEENKKRTDNDVTMTDAPAQKDENNTPASDGIDIKDNEKEV